MCSVSRRIFDRILSLTEASERTGLSESWMRRLLMSGRLKGKKVGKTWLVLAEDVDALAAEQRRPGRPIQSMRDLVGGTSAEAVHRNVQRAQARRNGSSPSYPRHNEDDPRRRDLGAS